MYTYTLIVLYSSVSLHLLGVGEGRFLFITLACHLRLDQPRGVGEKKLLREAATILGCHSASKLPKRAIQFGSQMARLAGSSNSRELGSDVCKRLLPNIS